MEASHQADSNITAEAFAGNNILSDNYKDNFRVSLYRYFISLPITSGPEQQVIYYIAIARIKPEFGTHKYTDMLRL